MRTAMLTLAACGLMVLPTAADEPSKKGKDGVVREIDLKGFKTHTVLPKGDLPKGPVTKPTAIASAEELKKAISDKEWRERILKQVDFAKEKLLFFAWSASWADQLSFQVEKDKTPPTVVFSYSPGVDDDLRPHFRLFAIPKDASWRVEVKK